MINQIIENFIENILENKNELISEISKFYFLLSEVQRTILKNETEKIIPVENSTRIPKEIFAFLFTIGNNSRQLKKIGFSDQEIKEAFTDYFDKAKNSDFIKSLHLTNH
jgi:hypothetical protein